jgi:alpha-L-fucosidase
MEQRFAIPGHEIGKTRNMVKIVKAYKHLVALGNTPVLNAAPNRDRLLMQSDIDTLLATAKVLGISR